MSGHRPTSQSLLTCQKVFLDVVESVNLLVNSNGSVVRSEVVGALKMRTYLSGMPECKLGLNDKVGSSHLYCNRNTSDCSLPAPSRTPTSPACPSASSASMTWVGRGLR